MATGEHTTAHCAGIVVELHFEIGRSHTSRLPSPLLFACGETGRAKWHPSEQTESKYAKRNGDAYLAAQSKKDRKAERDQPSADLGHARRNFRIDFGNNVERP